MKSEKIVISALMNIFHSKGYVTFDDILEHCAIYELTFTHADIIYNHLMDKGVRIEWYGSQEKSEIPIIDDTKETEISVCSSVEKPEQVVINTLYTRFQSQGYITEDDFYKSFEKAMAESDEKGWRLPLDDEYFDMLKSTSADIKNSAGTPIAGASVAATFLNFFVEEGTKWIHLDIAGTADKDGKAATGAMIRSVVNVLQK